MYIPNNNSIFERIKIMTMKNLIYSLIFISVGLTSLQAQVNRSHPPKPLPERDIQFGTVTEMRLKNGLTALIVENHKLPTVDISLYLDNGPLFEGNKAGVSEMMGDMMRAGTTNYTKDQLDEAMDYLGSDFYFGSSSARVSTLKNKLYPSLDLFTEVLYNPTFDNSNELEKLKKQMLTGLEAEAKNPDAISRKVNGAILYGKNDPYGEFATQETVNNIQLSDFSALYKERMIPNNAYLTFVGDITPKEVKDIMSKYYKKWKKDKSFERKEFPISPNRQGNYIAFVDLPTASQSVITISNLNDYKKANSDYFAARLGNSILGGGSSGRLFKNIREDKGWTYGAYSSLDDSYHRLGDFSASAKVRNAVTDSAVVEFMKEIKKMGTSPVGKEELEIKKAEYNGNFVLGLENPETVGRFARNIIIENLPERFYKDYLKEINAVTPSQIEKAMQRYTDPSNLIIFVVGKGSEVVPQLETLKMPIKYFDTQGNEIPKPEFTMEVPKGMTAKMVLEKAVEARGGMEKLSSVKSVVLKYSGEVQGQDFLLTMKKMAPNFLNIKGELTAMGMVAMEQKFDGTKGSISQMGQTQEMPEDMVDELKNLSAPIDEIAFLNNAKDFTLTAIEPVNGKNAYRLDKESKTSKTSLYYDYNTGLLSQQTTTMKDPATGEENQTIISYSNYKDYDGVLFPSQLAQSFGPMNLDFKLESAETNVNIPLSDFQ